ncbi:similar to Saccharomyces cerevisiae YGR130C Component of the eisosome with unknown function [Maudiozyma saulgeensis]|uniref:Uncharacterized protein n=1 Tax=Maudiozyma saulgeensis TaxID=1789683 RepID=A0A1X7QXE6_9SACH|nr:similar to Saccharomyces cerevisiae YGR130C Component of the eisosome with unknown function [Kazachstania saulgeensis]
MLKINSPKANDTFSDIIRENERIKRGLPPTNTKKNSFAMLKNTKDYVSPFRSGLTGVNKTQLQAIKTQRFPTTSATSDYNNLSTKELGFKNLKDSDKRIKDIKFPQYLTENEIRQAGIINDLKGKEDRLNYWNNSQQIIDYTQKSKSKSKSSEKNEILQSNESTNKFNEIRLNDQLEDAKALNLSKESNIKKPEIEEEEEEEDLVETASIPMFTNIGKLIQPTIVTGAAATSTGNLPNNYVCMDSSNQSIINKNSLVDATDLINRYKVLKPPMDPQLAPKVPYSDPSMAHKTTQGQNEADQQINPIASPDEKEMIVKIDKYGHLSKAVYDKVIYEGDVHTNYLIDFDEQQRKKYNDKIQKYEDKFKRIQQKREIIQQKMNQLKMDTLGKLEVIDNKLIKDIMDSNAKYTDDKAHIMKETELTKLKKLNECKFFYQKQKLIQGQINVLGVERSNVYDNFTEFATHMNNVSGELDAKLFRLNQINYQSDQIRKEIEGLEQKRTVLEKEIQTNETTNETNTKTLSQLQTGEHEKNQTLNTINDTINDRLALLAIVKQESKNENLKIAQLTDKINQKNKETETRMQKEIDDNKTNYENIIAKNKTDLEQKLADLEVTHKERLDQITKDYDEKVATLQKKVTQQQEEKEEAAAAAARAKLSAAPEDNSLYSYETEEEIIYQ